MIRRRRIVVLALLGCSWLALAPAPAAALSDAATRKAATKCQKAIAQGGAKLASVELKALDACVKAIAICVQTKPGDAGCTTKAEQKCAKSGSTTNAAATKYQAAILKACGPPLRIEDLLAGDGLGLASRAGMCKADFQLDICTDVSQLAQCLVAEHSRSTEALFSFAQPRSHELLQAVLANPPAFDGLADYECDGCLQLTPDVSGKTVVACGAAITKAAHAFASAVRKTVDECTGKIFACVQTQNADPLCLVKARAKCDAKAAKLEGARAKLRTGVQKKCGASVAPFAVLGAPPALNLAALAVACETAGTGPLGSLDDYLACLQRRSECAISDLSRSALPASDGYGTATYSGGAAKLVAGTDCVAPEVNALVASPRQARLGFTIGQFFKLRKTFSNGTKVNATSAAGGSPQRTGNAPRAITIRSSEPRFVFGALQKVKLRYLGANARGGAALARYGSRAATTIAPTLIVTIRHENAVLDDHLEVPLDAVPPDGFADVDLEFEYEQGVPLCAFDIGFAVGEGGEVSDYAPLPQVIDTQPTPNAEPTDPAATTTRTPTPIRTVTPTAEKTTTPTPARTTTPTPTRTTTPTKTATVTPTKTPTPGPTPGCTTTQAIQCGETASGTIAALGAAHCYTFDVQAGEAFSVTTTATSGTVDACYAVFSLAGPSATFCGQRAFQVGSQGTFTIRVFDQSNDETGGFNVSLDAISATFNGAPNGTDAPTCQRGTDGTQPIHCGETVSRAIDVPGDTDTFTFSALAGEVVHLRAAGTSGNVSICPVVYAPNGDLVSGCAGGGLLLPAQSGVYTIKINDGSDDGTGSYNLTLDFVSEEANGQPAGPACQSGGDGASTIACGETTSGTIGAPGDADVFTFHAQGGEKVAITTAETTAGFTACWTLFAPDGSRVGNTSTCGQDEVPLPLQPGTYTIAVFSLSTNQAGAYNLSLDAVSATFDGASNGGGTPTCKRGTEGTQPLACGATTTGVIDVPGDTDTFTFQAQGNDAVAIDIASLSGGVNACWKLFAPDGSEQAASCFFAARKLPFQTGTYTIKVYDSSQNQAGAYNLTLQAVSSTFAGSDAAVSCADVAAITCGDTKSGQIDAASDLDAFRFDAKAAETVAITSTETSASFTSCWSLFAPDGATVDSFCGQDEPTLPQQNGTYTIIARSSSGTGSYNLSVDPVSATFNGNSNGTSTPTCQRAGDGTQPIACGETKTGAIDVIGDTDTFTFSAAASDTVSIAARSSTGEAVCWALFAPNGASVSSACNQSDAGLPFQAGIYTIKTYDSGQNGTSTYAVTVDALSATFNGQSSAGCTAGGDGTQTLACNETKPGTFNVLGDTDTFTFTGTGGQLVTITSAGTGPSVNPCWRVFAPNGAVVGGLTCNGDAQRSLPPQSGTYTIKLFENGENNTGGYTIALGGGCS